MQPAHARRRRARRPSAARGASARGAKSKGPRWGAAARGDAPRQVDHVRCLRFAEKALNQDDARRPRQEHGNCRHVVPVAGAYVVCGDSAGNLALAAPARQVVVAADVRQGARGERRGSQARQEQRREAARHRQCGVRAAGGRRPRSAPTRAGGAVAAQSALGVARARVFTLGARWLSWRVAGGRTFWVGAARGATWRWTRSPRSTPAPERTSRRNTTRGARRTARALSRSGGRRQCTHASAAAAARRGAVYARTAQRDASGHGTLGLLRNASPHCKAARRRGAARPTLSRSPAWHDAATACPPHQLHDVLLCVAPTPQRCGELPCTEAAAARIDSGWREHSRRALCRARALPCRGCPCSRCWCCSPRSALRTRRALAAPLKATAAAHAGERARSAGAGFGAFISRHSNAGGTPRSAVALVARPLP